MIPSLYHEFKRFGPRNITDLSTHFDYTTRKFVIPSVPATDPDAIGVLERTWARYGYKRASGLVALTHKPGTPWSQVNTGDVIPDDLIREHFENTVLRS